MAGVGIINRYVRRMIYPAPAPAPPTDPPPGAQIVRTDAPHPTVVLHAPAPAGARTVIYFHGNGADINGVGPLLATVVDAGLGFAAVEYPGYGPLADQVASEATLYATADRALTHLSSERGITPDQMVLVGHSLGTAVAVEMVSRGHGRRLVLSAPFTSAADMVRLVGKYLPARLLTADEHLDSLTKAPSIAIPTIVIHGADDAAVPVAMSAKLAEQLPDAVRVVLAGRGHNDIDDAIARVAVIAATQPPQRWPALLNP